MLAALFALLPLLASTSASPINKRQIGVLIESGRTPGTCLSIQGGRSSLARGEVSNGTPVDTEACSSATLWDISRGSGSIVATGTNFALDIGLTPGNNGKLKVWESYPGSIQQTWYLTDDNRIAHTGGNQCLDLGDYDTQTYQCSPGNNNQVWNVRFDNAPTTVGFFSDVPFAASVKDTPGMGSRIRLAGREDLCVMVAGGSAYVGAPVVIEPCTEGTYANLQEWDLPTGIGLVRLHSAPDFCLDAGSNPSSGGVAKIWSCGDGYPQQQWTLNANLLSTVDNQCLDVRKESTPQDGTPYGSLRDVQTWECPSNNDPYMTFTVQS